MPNPYLCGCNRCGHSSNHPCFPVSGSGRSESSYPAGILMRVVGVFVSELFSPHDAGYDFGNAILLPDCEIQISFTATPIGRCNPFKHIALRSIL